MTTVPSNPHDAFFKQVLTRPDTAADFLRHYLPAEVAGQLDPTTLAISKDSFIDSSIRSSPNTENC